MTELNMLVRKIFPEELAWANEQYSEINFKLSTESDLIAIAEINGVKAGLGRLCAVDNKAGELGGMFVLPDFRGHAIAANIVDFLLKNSNYSTLYCLAFAHLEVFYKRFGFLPVDETKSVPKEVTDKFLWCRDTYDSSVLLMCREEFFTD
ncbi:GNAT family N-acetyltransferase [Solimicrobium silvestre]|uniref:N-acetylglutamate synthase and related acetyltransferase n=1 Tax=Solimicrobium silvestre TaxID=2099400 RepID=A0A2S9GXV0_9BURK|nr:GNAT family N-acetyltransferase [Solimicrobium silvestre]PRC92486.1 N-acetylglutamate synthase and related acetyltransferase [Solimicrobium silvestre]